MQNLTEYRVKGQASIDLWTQSLSPEERQRRREEERRREEQEQREWEEAYHKRLEEYEKLHPYDPNMPFR